MKFTNFAATFAAAAVLMVSACTPATTTEPTPTTSNVVEITSDILTNVTWTADKVYLLKDFVHVRSGATLTVEPGTIIKGDKVSKASLIILPGGKISAIGTAAKPIVFTSNQAAGQRAAGDWGGLILLGKGIVNKAAATVEGEGSLFGGTDNTDNSGTLKFVRIEFAGIAFEPDKEINGLTLGGVGSGTTIDYVQVSYSGDDSFEWFGGAVNCKHLVSYAGVDDDFDTDNGFSGNVQYGVALRDPAIADLCTCSSSNGFESDNDGAGTTATPQTTANFANMSVYMAPGAVNAKFNDGALIRRNSAMSLYNSVIVANYPKAGLELNGTASQTNFVSDLIKLQGIVLAEMGTKTLTTDARFADAASKNYTAWSLSDLKLDANYNVLKAPKFLPTAASPLLVAANAATLPTAFEATNYIGAFNTSDWTATWTNFDPQNTKY